MFKHWILVKFGDAPCMHLFLVYICRIKTGSGRGLLSQCTRARAKHEVKSRRRSRRDLTYCSHKPECIVTTNPDRSVLIIIITWHFWFYPMDVRIPHLNDDHRGRSESHFACYSHCYITWHPLATGNCCLTMPSSRDAVLVTRYLEPFISKCLNAVKIILTQ